MSATDVEAQADVRIRAQAQVIALLTDLLMRLDDGQLEGLRDELEMVKAQLSDQRFRVVQQEQIIGLYETLRAELEGSG